MNGSPTPPETLNYATPRPAPARLSKRDVLIRWMGVALFVAGIARGIGADFTLIPLPKKCALTASLILIPILVATTVKKVASLGFAFALGLGLWSLLAVFVMWFWN